MPSIERAIATGKAERQPSIKDHAKLFISGIRQFHSLNEVNLDDTRKSALLKSIARHALYVLTAPEWQRDGLKRIMARKINGDPEIRSDANRILSLGVSEISNQAINESNIDAIRVGEWENRARRAFGLSYEYESEPKEINVYQRTETTHSNVKRTNFDLVT